MRIVLGQVQFESNTFVLQPAGLQHFRNDTLLYGEEVLARLRGTHAEMGGAIDVLEAAGVEIVPMLAAHGVSSGIVPTAHFAILRDDLLARLAVAGPLDGVLLVLHGAMVADGDYDAEGALLEAVRECIGPRVPLVATLDLHGIITPRMVQHADALVGYQTYPHVDMDRTGRAGADLLIRAARREIRPVTALARAPMIVPAEGQGTRDLPMRDFVAAARAWEAEPGVLAVSLFPVQPWLDIPEMGFSVVVVVDGAERAAAAEARAGDLARRVWDARHRFDAQLQDVDDAIRLAISGDGGPYILSESADGTGAGSPGDSVAVLERLLALGVTERCLVSVVDAPAVHAAITAGVGSEVEVAVGGTLDPRYTRPVRVRGRVRLLSDGRYVFTGSEFTGTEGNMGLAAVIQVGSISVLAMSQPTFTIDPAFYRAAGLEPRDAKIVVVKSALQFRDNYGHFAKEQWVVDTPGPSTANLARLTWERIPRPLYPFDDDFEPTILTARGGE